MSERLFIDTNIFVATITDEPDRGPTAQKLLNSDYEFHTSLLNLLELRTVLTKKKQLEQEQVEETIEQISERAEVFIHEASDIISANELQQENLLYPMDCLVLAAAEDAEAKLVTFDAEVLDAGATAPSDLLN